MADSFQVEKSSEGEITVLQVEGYLDAHTAPDFEKALEEAIQAGQHKIIVDCAKLDYISSAGLGVFMGFVEEVREQAGDIKICGLIPKVRQVFELLGFQQLYHIEDDRPAALAKFEESPTWGG
ncbi:MAG TPA: STAS domain-containing protein [Acidobacteriota bacterium]|nr:STAS domain-containing protein [Acidobacteriota bacterium]